MLFVVACVSVIAFAAAHLIFGDILFGYYWACWKKPEYRSLRGAKRWWLEHTTCKCQVCETRYKKHSFYNLGYCSKHEYLYFEQADKLAREKRIREHVAHLEEKREAILRFRMRHATTYRVAAEEEVADEDRMILETIEATIERSAPNKESTT